MKTTIMIIVVVAGFILMANPKLSFNPFSLELRSWGYALGFFFILIGMLFIKYDSFYEGKKEMYNHFLEALQELEDEAPEDLPKKYAICPNCSSPDYYNDPSYPYDNRTCEDCGTTVKDLRESARSAGRPMPPTFPEDRIDNPYRLFTNRKP